MKGNPAANAGATETRRILAQLYRQRADLDDQISIVEKEFLAFRRAGGRVLPNPAECGSEGGYKKHRRAGEVPCRACTTAHARAAALRQAQPVDNPVDNCPQAVDNGEF